MPNADRRSNNPKIDSSTVARAREAFASADYDIVLELAGNLLSPIYKIEIYRLQALMRTGRNCVQLPVEGRSMKNNPCGTFVPSIWPPYTNTASSSAVPITSFAP